MKRVGHIFDAVIEPANLRLAFYKASRGKHAKSDQRAFEANLEAELERIRVGLMRGDYPVGNYRRFTILDPKERTICAASFGERVVHHALMNVCEPYFDRWLIGSTFACRKGKGQIKAVEHAFRMASRYKWFLKCDIRKFFDSIPHEGLSAMLARRIKDPFVRGWFNRIIGTYETTPGRGLPIGNLTSQHFANLYLAPIDRMATEHPVGYVRYMDDFVFFSDSKDELKILLEESRRIAEEELGLELKANSYINRTEFGMDFLGMRIFRNRIAASRKSRTRFTRKVMAYERLYDAGIWSDKTLQERVTALTAFVQMPLAIARRRRAISGERRRASGSNRVQRGGNWNNDNYNNNFPSSNRNNNNPSNRNNNNGFRLCCSAPAAPQGEMPLAVPVVFPSPAMFGANKCKPGRLVAPSECRTGMFKGEKL